MSEKTVTAEALGVVHKKGNVAVATGASLKVPPKTHEPIGKVVVAATSMPAEEEKRKGVYVARKEVPVPR